MYIILKQTQLGWGNIDGKQAVYGCECNQDSKYEQFIWNHRYIIADYLIARATQELKDAKKESQLAERVKTSIEVSK